MSQKKKAVFFIGSIVLMFMVIVACATEPIATTSKPQTTVVAQQETVAPKPAAPETPKEVKPAAPYTQEITPLTPDECARCHSSVYNQIKSEGGKHKIDCTKCHTKYHAYNPIKQNWDEIMPKCKTCHGLIHGDKFASCGSCHSNPHAPKTQMAMTPEFAKVCGDCHTKVSQELQKNPSKHTKVACAMCHRDKHGYIPSCMECHKPHTATLTVKECLGCHPVHAPLRISYALNTPNDICGSCHTKPYDQLKVNQSKHSLLACSTCHTKHRFVPKCEACHSSVHPEGLLKKFPSCSQCHVSAHNLPSKSVGK